MKKSKTYTKSKRTKGIRLERLKENVSKYPNNLQAAFRLTARQTNATKGAIQAMYYGTGKKGRDGQWTGLREREAMFITHTIHGITVNRKCSSVTKETKRTLKLSQKQILVGEMSGAEKIAFFDVLFK